MNRQLRGLSYKVFDLLVIGGGVHGSAIAWEAASRGLDVALLERGDFASATSGNSLKIVHGGLRYLQHLDFGRVRESIRERSILLRTAPHLVRPLSCILPLYRGAGLKSPFFMGVALKAADAVGWDRNEGIEAERSLPSGRVVPEREAARLAPGVRRDGLVGGAVWTDAQMMNPARLVLSMAISAQRAGASVINHADVRSLIRAGRRVIGATLRDRLTGQEVNLWARMTINAAGPWCEDVAKLAETGGSELSPGLTAAMNLLVRRPLTGSHAIGATKPGGQVFFIVPWKGMTLIGTRHSAHDGGPDRFRVRSADVALFLNDVNAALPAARLQPSDVCGVMSGLLPGAADRNGNVELLKRQKILDHEKRDGIPGFISVVSVKFTTARAVATQAVGLALKRLGRSAAPSRTHVMPLYGGNTGPFTEFLVAQAARHASRFPAALIQRLVETYGSEYERVLSYAEGAGAAPLDDTTPVIGAEVEFAAKNELAYTLADVVFRRTEMSVLGPASPSAIEAAADIMARVHGWEGARRRREISFVEEQSAAAWAEPPESPAVFKAV